MCFTCMCLSCDCVGGLTEAVVSEADRKHPTEGEGHSNKAWLT